MRKDGTQRFLTSLVGLLVFKDLDRLNVIKSVIVENMIFKEYTLDNFIVNDSNRLAYTIAQSIIKEPTKYNPFYLHGEFNAGKTHLLHAISNALKETHKNIKILYVSGEQFVSDIREMEPDKLKERYRNYDVVIIDDLCSCFANWMERTQKAVMELMDDLLANNKQLLIASELPLSRFPYIENHFRSHYESGIALDILHSTLAIS